MWMDRRGRVWWMSWSRMHRCDASHIVHYVSIAVDTGAINQSFSQLACSLCIPCTLHRDWAAAAAAAAEGAEEISIWKMNDELRWLKRKSIFFSLLLPLETVFNVIPLTDTLLSDSLRSTSLSVLAQAIAMNSIDVLLVYLRAHFYSYIGQRFGEGIHRNSKNDRAAFDSSFTRRRSLFVTFDISIGGHKWSIPIMQFRMGLNSSFFVCAANKRWWRQHRRMQSIKWKEMGAISIVLAFFSCIHFIWNWDISRILSFRLDALLKWRHELSIQGNDVEFQRGSPLFSFNPKKFLFNKCICIRFCDEQNRH